MQVEARWGSSQLSEAVRCLWFAFIFFFFIQFNQEEKNNPQPNTVFHNNWGQK